MQTLSQTNVFFLILQYNVFIKRNPDVYILLYVLLLPVVKKKNKNVKCVLLSPLMLFSLYYLYVVKYCLMKRSHSLWFKLPPNKRQKKENAQVVSFLRDPPAAEPVCVRSRSISWDGEGAFKNAGGRGGCGGHQSVMACHSCCLLCWVSGVEEM